MNKKRIVQLQEDKNDCAAACLLSIIKYYGGYLDMESVRNIINTTKEGTNAYDIVKGSSLIGFQSYGKKVDFSSLNGYKDMIPIIAHIKKNGLYHFVVIYSIDDKKEKILVMDPGVGLVTYKYKDFQELYLGVLLFFSKVKELPNIKNDNKLLNIIYKGLLKNKKKLILLSILSLISFILVLVDTLYYKIIIDNNLLSKDYFIKYGIIFISIVVIKNLFILFRNKLSFKVNYNLDLYINKEMVSRLFCLPYSYYKNKSTGEVISRINDLESLKELLSSLVLNTFVDVLLIVISFTLMFIINKKLTIMCVFIILLYVLMVKLYHKKFSQNIRLIQESKGFYNHNLIETLDGMESIRNLNIDNIRKERIEKIYLDYSNLNKKMNTCFVNQNFLKGLVNDIGMILLLTVGGILIMENNLTIGEFLLIYMVINYFLSVIKSLLDKDFEITYILKNMDKVNGMLVTKDNVKCERKIISGDIVVKNLSYKNGDKVIISNQNLIIYENDKLLLCGKSGSGKSTLLKILLKYLDNYEGSVFINNTDISLINNDDINENFVYVGQNEKLFNDTFKNNILLGRYVIDEDYDKVIKICELEKFRDSRKFKDEFMIESDGFNISGGERQRIVLARALLKKSNYIILDEALSEVNSSLEKKIIENIFKYYKDNTLIYVTHKEEIKKLFSKIYDLERRAYEKRRIS